MDQLNYDSWKELFKTHCARYKVYNHIDGSSPPTDDPNWETVNNIVKQWIYASLTQPIIQAIITTNVIVTEVWKAIESLFHVNKKSKTLKIDDKLRNINIGDSTIMEYCTYIKSISDLLANFGAPVPKQNVAMYASNGLSQK